MGEVGGVCTFPQCAVQGAGRGARGACCTAARACAASRALVHRAPCTQLGTLRKSVPAGLCAADPPEGDRPAPSWPSVVHAKVRSALTFGTTRPEPTPPHERPLQVVLGPCVDGGYYLLGLRRVEPCLFQVGVGGQLHTASTVVCRWLARGRGVVDGWSRVCSRWVWGWGLGVWRDTAGCADSRPRVAVGPGGDVGATSMFVLGKGVAPAPTGVSPCGHARCVPFWRTQLVVCGCPPSRRPGGHWRPHPQPRPFPLFSPYRPAIPDREAYSAGTPRSHPAGSHTTHAPAHIAPSPPAPIGTRLHSVSQPLSFPAGFSVSRSAAQPALLPQPSRPHRLVSIPR